MGPGTNKELEQMTGAWVYHGAVHNSVAPQIFRAYDMCFNDFVQFQEEEEPVHVITYSGRPGTTIHGLSGS